MISGDFGKTVANGFLLVANILNTAKIDKLVVPELVQIGNASDVVLDCQYRVSDEQFTVRWLFNRSDTPVYEWTPGSAPVVSGILDGRLDLSYKASPSPIDEYRAMRIVRLDPELSGEYTCSVISGGAEARQTRTMLVFSPEREFVLEMHHHRHHDYFTVRCIARGLYPQPDLIIEHNHEPIAKQQTRVWRSSGALFDAESSARLHAHAVGGLAHAHRLTCRLQLPQAGYTAIKEEYLQLDKITEREEEEKELVEPTLKSVEKNDNNYNSASIVMAFSVYYVLAKTIIVICFAKF